jgi:dihydroneopterin aldolase
MATICLEDTRVQQVRILVEKPTALRFARTVGVEITRHR